MNLRSLKFSPKYARPLKFAVVEQVLLMVLSAFVMDTGEFANITVHAIIAYWALALIMLLRRPLAPTSADLIVLKWGTFLFFGISFFLTPFIWSLRADNCV